MVEGGGGMEGRGKERGCVFYLNYFIYLIIFFMGGWAERARECVWVE